jgi:hypothetical protein
VTNFDPQPPQVHQVYFGLVPRQPSNGLAIAGLVCGIVGAALSLIPFAGPFLCWLPALLAIIFGFVGSGTARKNGLRRKESLAAIWLGIAPILVVAFYIIVIPVLAGIGASTSGY